MGYVPEKFPDDQPSSKTHIEDEISKFERYLRPASGAKTVRTDRPGSTGSSPTNKQIIIETQR